MSFGLTAAEPHLMRRIREKTPAARTVMVGDASAVEVPSAIRAVEAGEAVGPPRFLSSTIPRRKLSNLQLGKICRFEARLGLAGLL
jgi:hypothetical protein